MCTGPFKARARGLRATRCAGAARSGGREAGIDDSRIGTVVHASRALEFAKAHGIACVRLVDKARPTLMKLITSGEIAHVKVGTHHRIPAQAILEFQRARKTRREEAAEALASFSNEIGFVD